MCGCVLCVIEVSHVAHDVPIICAAFRVSCDIWDVCRLWAVCIVCVACDVSRKLAQWRLYLRLASVAAGTSASKSIVLHLVLAASRVATPFQWVPAQPPLASFDYG